MQKYALKSLDLNYNNHETNLYRIRFKVCSTQINMQMHKVHE